MFLPEASDALEAERRIVSDARRSTVLGVCKNYDKWGILSSKTFFKPFGPLLIANPVSSPPPGT